MASLYAYNVWDDFPSGRVNLSRFQEEILASTGIVTALDRIDTAGGVKTKNTLISGVINIYFDSALSASEKTELDGDIAGPAGGLIAAHDNSISIFSNIDNIEASNGAVICGTGNAWSTLPPENNGDILTLVSGLPAWQSGSYGDVSGPGSSTDNAIARFDGTGGKTIQNSEVLITDSGNVENPRLVTFRGEFDNGNSGAAATINWNEGQKQRITLNSASTFTFVPPPEACNLLLKIIHVTGTGAITWPTGVFFPNGTDPDITNVNTAVDIISFYFDGLEYYAIGSFDFL